MCFLRAVSNHRFIPACSHKPARRLWMETVTRHFRPSVRQSDVGRKKTARIPSRYRCVLILAVFFRSPSGVCVCVVTNPAVNTHAQIKGAKWVEGWWWWVVVCEKTGTFLLSLFGFPLCKHTRQLPFVERLTQFSLSPKHPTLTTALCESDIKSECAKWTAVDL